MIARLSLGAVHVWRRSLRRPGTARRLFSSGGRRPTLVRSPGLSSTGGTTTTPGCSCGTSRRRCFGVGAVSAEVLEALSGPGSARLDGSAPGRRGRAWRDSSNRSCSCWTISTSSTIDPVWTSSRSSSGTFRAARRSRSRAARRRQCRSPAGGRRGGCTRSACRTSDSTSRRPGCCSRRSESSSTRPSSPS